MSSQLKNTTETQNTKPNVDSTKINQKDTSVQPLPQAQHEITYSLDSADESIVVDTLINNPKQLRQKLKQSKMDREQLTQLQENYLRLLEQYAEAENFIDTFRLGAAHTKSNSNLSANTPSLNMFQVRNKKGFSTF
jgi:Tfp pilus assembly protein FimV